MLGLADTSVLSRWEHGLVLPNIEQVLRLSLIYETEPQQLFDTLWETLRIEYGLLSHPDSYTPNPTSTL
jgi:hypothetical protein